tara:strand:+ start:2985 stop:4379 length:1395 start_codon:yes stop_codon:yes gene_type:complete
MKIIFVHGWSVTNTDTYGELPKAIVARAGQHNLDIQITHLDIARYISFHDEVTVDDIAKAMDSALRDMPGNQNGIQEFSCITHSTGGPVVREWVDRFYGSRKLANLPLKHLVMLAPANHGSSLAVLGKEKLSRIKSWFGGVEPGQKVLDWLSLGSFEQLELNEKYLRYNYSDNGFFPFVLTGQAIDKKFYDFINDYLVEPGSDGVVRVAGANMNYRYLTLSQTDQQLKKSPKTYALKPPSNAVIRKPKITPIGIFNSYSHSGKKMGIMRSITTRDSGSEPIVDEVLRCLAVKTASHFTNRTKELADFSKLEQAGANRYAMIVINVHDDEGNKIERDNYDVFLLAGKTYSPSSLPKGFFQDRQINSKSSNLVYYVNADKMGSIKDGKFGIRIVARPDKGFSYYSIGEFRSEGFAIEKILAPNETTYVDITMRRQIDKNVFTLVKASKKSASFKRTPPSGNTVNGS